MSRRAESQSAAGHRWMISYVDVLTILLIFFITAAAAMNRKSSPPGVPASALVQNPSQKASGDQDPGLYTREKNDALKSGARGVDPALAEVERKLKEAGLDVSPLGGTEGDVNGTDLNSDNADRRGLVIHLSQAVLFSAGDDRVQTAALPDLQKIADALRDIPNKVNLAGHADSVPIHNHRFRNNWELAAARSLRLMEALTERYGVDESRVSISSYGSVEPKNPNDTPGGRASNRRVEVLIFSEPAH